MFVRIDTTSGIPLRQQITDQVKRTIAAGTVLPGDRLPTVRELAIELRINPNTVARAYQDLEQEDVVETRRGLGTYARAPGSRLDGVERRRIVAAHIDGALVEAIHLGIAPEQIREIVEERIGRLFDPLPGLRAPVPAPPPSGLGTFPNREGSGRPLPERLAAEANAGPGKTS